MNEPTNPQRPFDVEYKFTLEVERQRAILFQMIDECRAAAETRVRAIPKHYPREEQVRLIEREIQRYRTEAQPFIDSLAHLQQFATVIVFHERTPIAA